jgi:hypothetical protein
LEDINKEIEQIRRLLLTKRPSYETTNKKEIRVRCAYCGDSKKDPTHAHMYIEMKPPFKFYCQRCSTSGVLNMQTLRDLNIYSTDLSTNIINANKTIKKNDGHKFKIYSKKPDLVTNENEFTQNALNYFNNRFQTNYTNEEIINKFKVITNAQAFFEKNNIRIPIDARGVPLYDFNNSIGFLSSDGTHVIFRDLTNQQRKRYFNLNLYNNDIDTANKLYNIKSAVDIMKDEITLIIAEGAFDIIGVYEAFYKNKKIDNDHIFAAAAGKGYNAAISHYIRMGFLNLKVIIYSDTDVNQYFFKNLKDSSPYLKNSRLTIFYNNLEKDFGVPKDRIKLRKIIV